MNKYYFSGWFTTRAYACFETDGELTEEEINYYLGEGLYELNWGHGHKGEVVNAVFDEAEYDGPESYAE